MKYLPYSGLDDTAHTAIDARLSAYHIWDMKITTEDAIREVAGYAVRGSVIDKTAPSGSLYNDVRQGLRHPILVA